MRRKEEYRPEPGTYRVGKAIRHRNRVVGAELYYPGKEVWEYANFYSTAFWKEVTV